MVFRRKSCKLQLEILRTTFADYDSFVRTFADNARLAIEGADESLRTYTFDNQWKTSLNRNGNIELGSPMLTGEQAEEVHHLIEVLRSMNIKLGENCQARIRYSKVFSFGQLSKTIADLPLELIWGTALVLLMVTQTIELQFQRELLWHGIFLMQALGYFLFMVFAIYLFKGISRRPRFEHSRGSSSPTLDEPKPSARGMGQKPFSMSTQGPELNTAEITREIRDPLENIMAYTRFYQSTIDKESQHWKDLVEIMEQANRIQEIVNRAESITPVKETDGSDSSLTEGKNLFRRTPRTIELMPLVLRGNDFLGKPFETASYTLNVSPRGACLLLPDKSINVGQKINLQNHQFQFASEGTVRWILQGKTGNMTFAGVQFTKPVKMLLQAQSA